jgi:dUTPase
MIINFVQEHPKAKLPKFVDSCATGADLYAVEDVVISGTIDDKVMAWGNGEYGRPVPRAISIVTLETGISIASFVFDPYDEHEVSDLLSMDIQVRARSGLASKGLIILNGVGTIDHNYRGPIKIVVANIGKGDIEIKAGDRIAQMIVSTIHQRNFVSFKFVDKSQQTKTDRNQGGFGSSGR